MGDDAHQQSQGAQVTPRTAELRELYDELAVRVAAMEAQRDRAWRMADLLSSAAGPEPAPGPRHAAARRDRHGLRVIKGGLAAFAPAAVLLFHGGPGPAAGAVARWVWRVSNDHFKYVVAAVLLAIAGAAGPAVASMEPPAAHAPLMVPYGHYHGHDRPPARALHRAGGARHPRGRS